MTAFVYLICWSHNEGLATYGITGEPEHRKEWERWARSEYRPELRQWGKWNRAYTVPMPTVREARDWKMLMDEVTILRKLIRKHPWRHKDHEIGTYDKWCLSDDETVDCFNQTLQQFNDQTKKLPS